jgi:hypothetical protein
MAPYRGRVARTTDPLPVTTAQLFLLAIPIGGVVALGALWLDQRSR